MPVADIASPVQAPISQWGLFELAIEASRYVLLLGLQVFYAAMAFMRVSMKIAPAKF